MSNSEEWKPDLYAYVRIYMLKKQIMFKLFSIDSNRIIKLSWSIMQVNQSVRLQTYSIFLICNRFSNMYASIIDISRRFGAGASQGEFSNTYGSGGG